jgi:hypothetical protein
MAGKEIWLLCTIFSCPNYKSCLGADMMRLLKEKKENVFASLSGRL